MRSNLEEKIEQMKERCNAQLSSYKSATETNTMDYRSYLAKVLFSFLFFRRIGGRPFLSPQKKIRAETTSRKITISALASTSIEQLRFLLVPQLSRWNIIHEGEKI